MLEDPALDTEVVVSDVDGFTSGLVETQPG